LLLARGVWARLSGDRPGDVLGMLIEDASDRKDSAFAKAKQEVLAEGHAPGATEMALLEAGAEGSLELSANLVTTLDAAPLDAGAKEAQVEAAKSPQEAPGDFNPSRPFGKGRTTLVLECLYGLGKAMDVPTVKNVAQTLSNLRCRTDRTPKGHQERWVKERKACS